MRSWLALNAQRYEDRLILEEFIEELGWTIDKLQSIVDTMKERTGWPQCDCMGCNEE